MADDKLSSLPNGKDGQRYSVDSVLALERALDAESPTSPSFPSNATPATIDAFTSIVTDLRAKLAEFTSQNEELTQLLERAQTKNATLESRAADLDELYAAEKARADREASRADASEKLAEERDQSLTMLRSTLEESRRAIMRLQSDSKRSSVYGSTPPTPASTRAAKRMSLNPASPLPPTVSPRMGHRRISSMSDPGLTIVPPMPSPDGVTIDRGFPPTPSPPTPTHLDSFASTPSESLHPNPEAAALRAELARTRRALSEARDARQASEDCLRALREFIAANPNGGSADPELAGLRLPPLPTDETVDEAEEVAKEPPKKSGWAALRLWKDTAAAQSPPASIITSPQPPSHERILSTTSLSTEASETSSKSGLGGLWSRGASSSTYPANTTSPPSSEISLHSPAQSVQSPPGSFRSKFGFFSRVPSTSTDSASVTSRSSMSSENGGEDDSVKVVMPGSNDDDAIVEVDLNDGEPANAVKMRGDLTPTISTGGFPQEVQPLAH